MSASWRNCAVANLILGSTRRGERIAADEAGRLGGAPSRDPSGPPPGSPESPTQGGTGGAQPPRLRPLVLELYILVKERGVVRLGDTINHAQEAFLADCERQLATTGQIRVCVLKARQIGISTIIEAIAFALSMIHDSFSSLIVSHETDSTQNILAMTRRYWDTYLFAPYAPEERYASRMELAWHNGSGIKVATAKNVGAGRSRTIHLLHASEVAFWPDPETLMTGLRQAIPSRGLTAIFLESTANGLGNYFYRECNRSMRGVSEYTFHFYPWHEHPEYTAAYIPNELQAKYQLDKLDEEEQRLRSMFGVSDARLIWRRYAIANLCQGDIEKFHQEYPATPHEAFVSTGRNVFPMDSMLNHYEPLVGKRGKLLHVNGRIEFVAHPEGWLTLFAEPSDSRDWGVYLLGGDPTHTTVGDNACIQVINRRTLEQVAVYRRKIDPVNFGKDMQLVGRFFHDALLAPEKTGPGYATVGCVVADQYPNIYVTQNIAKMQGAPTDGLYGWLTNTQTKHLAISHLLKALTDSVVAFGGQRYGLMIHDEATFLELRDYVTTEDGTGYENGDGSEYDDGVMALAIAVTVNQIEPPPPPFEVSEASNPTPHGPVTPGLRSGTRLPTHQGPRDTRVAPPGPDYTGVELVDTPTSRGSGDPPRDLPRDLPDDPRFPDDFEDDAPPWEQWESPETP